MNDSALIEDPESTLRGGVPRAAGLSILWVEDDKPLLDSTAQAMTALGHLVYRAIDARQAESLLEANVVDVLMTDINLPDVSGEVLAAEARALHPEIKIVFVTGRRDIRDPMTSGLDPHLLRKPYNLAAIETLLDALTA